MKTSNNNKNRYSTGYALLMVLTIAGVSLFILAGTLSRTTTVARLNSRNNDLLVCQNAAEAAVESVFARLQYDFQSAGGPGTVVGNLNTYRQSVPKSGDDPFWGKFQFSDGSGSWNNRNYVNQQSLFTGELPQAYSGRFTANAPVYRILSNARLADGGSGVVGTAQQDVLLALVPLTSYAIFYNDLLEFSTCATMVVNGPVHSNTNIYVGAGGGATLTFNTTVTTSGTITAPANNGQSWSTPTNFNAANWRTYFNGSPSNFIQHLPTITIPIPMTNSYSLIETPTTSDYTTALGQQRLYNKAQIVILVSNSTVTATIQKGATSADLPAADGSPTLISTNFTATNYNVVTAKFPFLTITNKFFDRRENKTNFVTQIDLGKYREWISTNLAIVDPSSGKYPTNSGNYPTILYLADWRTNSSPSVLYSVRITNGIAPPNNGGQGFTLATPNPLYVWGDYNCTNRAYLGTTNTAAAGALPCALMSDALTILSTNWLDAASTAAYTTRLAADTTVNAAILSGIVPSTGSSSTTFSGGVHNLPRLLEDWNSPSTRKLTINTSMINLFQSRRATGKFINPGTYYDPPTRNFSYDLQFRDPTKVPPGMPCALVALRFGWATPPPNNVTYNVTP